MALRLKIGNYEPVDEDPLGRAHVGYFPRMTEQEAWEAGRGLWRISTEKAARQRFAVIVAEGRVRVVAEITGVTAHADRVALDGSPVAEDHPLRAEWLGGPDPVENGSQNPIGYFTSPAERPFLFGPCSCGCGETTDRDFLPGHDVRAIQARVRDHFAGSAREFLAWVDDTVAATGAVTGAATDGTGLVLSSPARRALRWTDAPAVPDGPDGGDGPGGSVLAQDLAACPGRWAVVAENLPGGSRLDAVARGLSDELGAQYEVTPAPMAADRESSYQVLARYRGSEPS